MPTPLIRWKDDRAVSAEDPFTNVTDEQWPPRGEVIVTLARWQSDGDRLIGEGRLVGVRLKATETVEDLVFDLPRIAVVALELPIHRDGRAFSSAVLLRERYGYKGEVRAVGDVFVEQARFLVRCGFDAFEPSDGSTPDMWTHNAHRYRNVYQRGADALKPAFQEREGV
jgi:uncharacterized protein (DUF934 family)